MNFNCPTCKGTHVRRLSLVHTQGLTHSKANTVSVGSAVDIFCIINPLFWLRGAFLMLSHTRGRSISKAAETAQPPTKRRWLRTIAILLVLLGPSFLAISEFPNP